MLKSKCPGCSRSVRLPFFRVATTVVSRTCRCGQRWAIKVQPLRALPGGGHVHLLEWVKVERTSQDDYHRFLAARRPAAARRQA